MRTLLARTGLLLLTATACLGVGCAAERDPINRTQPNALPKSFFLGKDLGDPKDDPEFRTKSFVVGAAVGQSQYGIGEFSAVDRIRWEITEDMLLARRAYQEAPGADNREVAPGTKTSDPTVTRKPSGTIVAAFRISSHFDIRRSYNPMTGEEANVIEENTSDRPWNRREYVRVDWSKNLVDSTNDSTRFFNSAKITPVEYDVTNPDDDDALHFENDRGYLDVTNKFTVEDEEIQFSWGGMKRCILTSIFTGTSTYDCNPTEATVRTSFARVDPEADFESFEDNYAWSDVVGNTGGERDGFNPSLGAARTSWDPQYGFTDAQTRRFKSLHNIWMKSLQATSCSSDEDTDKNGTADQCENAVTGWAGHSGSRCETRANKCSIPVRDREIKTIAYTLNREAPEALQDTLDGKGNVVEQGTMEQLGASWNQLIAVATAYRREVECRRTGDGDRDACHAEFFESDRTPSGKVMIVSSGFLTDKVKPLAIDKGKPSYYVCHNPARAYDPEESCGKPGTTTRLGDIRKNHLIYWPYESRARYGGIGWNPPDPVTGETFGATATVMGRSASRAAAMERDIIQLALGDTKIEDVMAGVPAERYGRMLQEGSSAPEAFRIAKTPAELARRIEAVDRSHLWSSLSARPLAGATALESAIDESKAKAHSTVLGTQFNAGISQFDLLAGRLKGSLPVLDELASPLRGLEPARLEAIRSWFEEDMAARGACFHDAANGGSGSLYLASLAGFFRKKYGDLGPEERGKRIYEDLLKETARGIGLHEIGHSLGLRHNFASSWDAPNYNPQYWQLRTNEGKSLQACNGPRSGSDDSCLGPRYVDPMTQDEQGLADESRPGIDYFGNTSTMEYTIERGGESVGLGNYDLHAMKMLYGRVLETFDERVIPAAEQKNFALKNYTQLQERDLVTHDNKIFSHYTTTARLMKVFDPARDCRPATEEEKAIGAWRVVHGKVCAPPPKDHWAFDEFTSETVPNVGINAVRWHAKANDGKDRVRWNYRWGEQYGAGGYMHTTMMDAGADVYELTQNLVRSFDLRYPWAYFRRGDREWVDEFLPQSVASQYFGRLRAYHWQIALGIGRAGDADLGSDDGMRPYVLAQSDIFSFLQNAALMPEPGRYGTSARHTIPGGREVFDLATSAGAPGIGGFTLEIGDARFIATDFENEKGGSWDYQKYVHHAGYEAEKALAMMQLVDPRPTLFTVARENYLDGRDVMVSFRSDLPTGVDRLLGGILSEDWESIAPYMTAEAGPAIRRFELVEKAISRPVDARIVFPNVGYKQQLSMGLYGALFSRLSSDMTLANKMRLWRDGDDAPVVAGTTEVRFYDPESGYAYVASRYGSDVVDGKTVDQGIASRMLVHANDLIAQAYEVKLGAGGKPILDAKGQPELVLASDGRPVKKGTEDAQLQLRRYVGLLDAMRQIGHALDGPLGN
jgi:hypothetical protein